MKKKPLGTAGKVVCFIAGVLSLLLIWALIAFILKLNGNQVVPYPHETFLGLLDCLFGLEAGKTYTAIGWTLLRLLIGFGVSIFLALILGTLAGFFPKLEYILKPFIIFSRTIPTAAVVILLLGIFYAPKTKEMITYVPCALVFLVAFPLLYEAFVKGIHELDPHMMAALSLDEEKAYRPRTLFKVVYPSILPYVLLAVTQSLGLAMKVTIMSEIVAASSAAKPSIGGLIVNAEISGEIEMVFVYALLALLLMLLVDVPFIVYKRHKAEKDL